MRQLFLMLAICALSLAVAGCQTQLFGDLPEKEANAVLAALLDAGVKAEKKAAGEGFFAVSVDRADFARAVKVLDDLALPAKKFDDLGKVFGGDTMFSTPMEERARYLHAMQEELSHTVSNIDGVLGARVHLVLPERDQLGRQLQVPSAAVFIRHVDDARHDPIGHRLEIVRLIAAAVPNLDEEHIVVTFFPVSPQAGPAGPPVWREVLGVRVAADGSNVTRLWAIVGGLTAAFAAAFALWLRGVVVARRKDKREIIGETE